MRFEGPDISQIVALTGFVLSAAVILAIIAKLAARKAIARPCQRRGPSGKNHSPRAAGPNVYK